MWGKGKQQPTPYDKPAKGGKAEEERKAEEARKAEEERATRVVSLVPPGERHAARPSGLLKRGAQGVKNF